GLAPLVELPWRRPRHLAGQRPLQRRLVGTGGEGGRFGGRLRAAAEQDDRRPAGRGERHGGFGRHAAGAARQDDDITRAGGRRDIAGGKRSGDEFQGAAAVRADADLGRAIEQQFINDRVGGRGRVEGRVQVDRLGGDGRPLVPGRFGQPGQGPGLGVAAEAGVGQAERPVQLRNGGDGRGGRLPPGRAGGAAPEGGAGGGGPPGPPRG